MNELRDPVAYRIAIGALGFAVATLLAGIAWIATVRDKTELLVAKDPPHVHTETQLVFELGHVPVELWFAAAALGGLFVGVLIPFATNSSSCACAPEKTSRLPSATIFAAIFFAIAGATLPAFGFAEDFLGLCVLATAASGLLLGLLIPSPVGRIGRGGC